jgi:hypothetical protein
VHKKRRTSNIGKVHKILDEGTRKAYDLRARPCHAALPLSECKVQYRRIQCTIRYLGADPREHPEQVDFPITLFSEPPAD